MLIYHPESDAFFWDENWDGRDGLCEDVTEILWCVVVARDRGIDIPDVERHLQYLRDVGADQDLPTGNPENPYWNNL